MFSGHVNYVVHAKPGDVHARKVERLRVRIPVGLVGKQLAKLVWIDVRMRQDGLLVIQTPPRVVVVIGGNADQLGRRRVGSRQEPRAQYQEGASAAARHWPVRLNGVVDGY